MNDTRSIHGIYECLQLRVFFLTFHNMIITPKVITRDPVYSFYVGGASLKEEVMKFGERFGSYSRYMYKKNKKKYPKFSIFWQCIFNDFDFLLDIYFNNDFHFLARVSPKVLSWSPLIKLVCI